MIVLITPTGGRPKQFTNCKKWMQSQTYRGDVLWLIVDDCVPTTSFVEEGFKKNWTIKNINPTPVWRIGMNTQGRNLLAAIKVVKMIPSFLIGGIFIIEDDDYYTPEYLSCVTGSLKGFDLSGTKNTVYYNIPEKKYFVHNNNNHASLFQLGFSTNVLSEFEKACRSKWVDVVFCGLVKNKNLFSVDKEIAVGIKGMSGRCGIGSGHRPNGRYSIDLDLRVLKTLINSDYKQYYE